VIDSPTKKGHAFQREIKCPADTLLEPSKLLVVDFVRVGSEN
jgi:hypothetical protein